MVGELAWGHHREGEMGLHVVVEIKESPDLFLKNGSVLLPVLVMPNTLLTERPIEALDVALLVLLVGTGIPVAFTVEENFLMAFGLELRASVTLPNDEASETDSSAPETSLPFARGQRFSHLDIGFSGERIDRRVCEEFPEIHSVALPDMPSLLCSRHLSSRVVVLLPPLPEDKMSPQCPIDTRETHISPVFLPEPEPDLLPTPAILSPNRQDELCGDGINALALPIALTLLFPTLEFP